MDIRKISDDYSVTGQISAADITAIRQAGFKAVICNRPDDEHPGEAPVDEVRRAAEAAGLDFRYIPVISGSMTAENVSDQAEALQELPVPVLAYCRSGTRCTNLYSHIHPTKS